MKLRLAIIVSLCAGFVSISMEIIWFTVVGYMFKGHAFTFSIVLALILFGIAYGAKLGYRAIKKPNTDVALLISKIMLVAGILNFISFPLVGWLLTIHSAFAPLLVISIVGISGMVGCIFPLLCHIAVTSNEHEVGKQTSLLYAANIIGATTGPLITGYVLIDYFPMNTIVAGLCVVLIVLSLIIRLNYIPFKSSLRFAGICGGAAVFCITLHTPLYAHFFEHIHFQGIFDETKKYTFMLQNRSGIIAVDQEDRVFGSGAYDGGMNVNPKSDLNKPDRAYIVGALHPNPEKVLMIGLSSGSWAKILSDYSKIKELTIIEINPGYLELIKKYPEIATILTDKKVKIIIDDGRRWIKRNSDQKFDMVVMNTTFHWRTNATNLLSIEFLRMCKNSLKGGGVVYWNPTRCPDIFYTAAHVFNNVSIYQSFVIASDSPLSLTPDEKMANFKQFYRNGKPLYEQPLYAEQMEIWSNTPLPNIHDEILKEDLFVITDNNMACEFKTDLWKIFKGAPSVIDPN